MQLEQVYANPHFNAGRLSLHHGDLSDAGSLKRLLDKIRPDEVYNLAAQSDVRISFDLPDYTADITATGVARLLEAIHESGLRPRFYQASSSEMFGKVRKMPQNELTPPVRCSRNGDFVVGIHKDDVFVGRVLKRKTFALLQVFAKRIIFAGAGVTRLISSCIPRLLTPSPTKPNLVSNPLGSRKAFCLIGRTE